MQIASVNISALAPFAVKSVVGGNSKRNTAMKILRQHPMLCQISLLKASLQGQAKRFSNANWSGLEKQKGRLLQQISESAQWSLIG